MLVKISAVSAAIWAQRCGSFPAIPARVDCERRKRQTGERVRPEPPLLVTRDHSAARKAVLLT
jgi:hypothetical protein